MNHVVIEGFAGPGGWSTGVELLDFGGIHVGMEWDEDACATAEAAGHIRALVDVAKVDPVEVMQFVELELGLTDIVWGLIMSPPCQGFSMAGKGGGRQDAAMLLDAISQCETHHDVDEAIERLQHEMTDPRSLLVLQPLRYVLAMRPAWTAWEQVTTVQPIWNACAKVLEKAGYTVETGTLNSEQYGVPQTRRRAILVASRVAVAALPAPTHSKYHIRRPHDMDPGVLPWVSMAEALGIAAESAAFHQRSNYSNTSRFDGATAADRGRTTRELDQPSVTITSKVFGWEAKPEDVEYVNGTGVNAARRAADLPAPTVHFGHRLNTVAWEDKDTKFAGAGRTSEQSAGQKQRPVDHPAHTITGKGTAAWVPKEKRSTRVSVEDAGVLQSFPADYPWQGTKTERYRQVGDAIPPVLAAAILRQFIGAPHI